MDRVSAAFILVTGAYLTWYWYASISGRNSDPVVGKVDDWQSWVVDRLQRVGTPRLAAVLIAATAIGIAFVGSHRTPSERQPDPIVGTSMEHNSPQELT